MSDLARELSTPVFKEIYRGKAEIAAYMKAASGKMKIDSIASMRIAPLLDPHGVTVELAVKGAMLKTGQPYDYDYASDQPYELPSADRMKPKEADFTPAAIERGAKQGMKV